jgi:hypothetical protein
VAVLLATPVNQNRIHPARGALPTTAPRVLLGLQIQLVEVNAVALVATKAVIMRHKYAAEIILLVVINVILTIVAKKPRTLQLARPRVAPPLTLVRLGFIALLALVLLNAEEKPVPSAFGVE